MLAALASQTQLWDAESAVTACLEGRNKLSLAGEGLCPVLLAALAVLRQSRLPVPLQHRLLLFHLHHTPRSVGTVTAVACLCASLALSP